MMRLCKWAAVFATMGLSACVVVPPAGPSAQALPGSRSTQAQYQFDDGECRSSAIAQAGGRSAAESAQESAVASTVFGTILGAAAGAAIGGNSASAGVGAGVGLLAGALSGVGAAEASYHVNQQRFDQAYLSCMYARGHRVPTNARIARAPAPAPAPRAPSLGVPPDYREPAQAAPAQPAPRYVPPYWRGMPPPDAPPPR
jgi:hypothetical protein